MQTGVNSPSIRILLPLSLTSSVSSFVYSSGCSNIFAVSPFHGSKIHYNFLCEGPPKTQKPLKHNLNSTVADESRLSLRNNLKSLTKYCERFAPPLLTDKSPSKFFTWSDFIQGTPHCNTSQSPLLHLTHLTNRHSLPVD